MKKVIFFFLSLLLILSLVSCATSGEEMKKTEEKEDLFSLSAQEIYTTAQSRTNALSSASFTTVLFEGTQGAANWITARIREGYDSFSYSRQGEGSVIFADGKIYVENALGKFFSPATTTVAREYLDTYLAPFIALSPEDLTGFEKSGERGVKYQVKNSDVLALFADLVPTAGIASVRGEAALTQSGLIEKETLFLCDSAGEEVRRLETCLSAYRSDKIQVATPAEEAEYVALGDIRIPHLLANAVRLLEEKDPLQATALEGYTLNAGENTLSHHKEMTYYKKGQEGYFSRQTLKRGLENTTESRFYQKKINENGARENEFDILTGTLIGENNSAAKGNDWNEVLNRIVLSSEKMKDLNLSGDTDTFTVTFQLGPQGLQTLSTLLSQALPEAGVDPTQVTGEGSGVFTFSKEKGILTAFSLTANLTLPQGTAAVHNSVTVEGTQEVTVPDMQTPTATAPGEVGDNIEHNH